jgi:hypothetical protein
VCAGRTVVTKSLTLGKGDISMGIKIPDEHTRIPDEHTPEREAWETGRRYRLYDDAVPNGGAYYLGLHRLTWARPNRHELAAQFDAGYHFSGGAGNSGS